MADEETKVHTPLDEPHPAGTDERSDREVGGPKAAEDAEGETGTEPGAHGDKPTEGFDAHE